MMGQQLGLASLNLRTEYRTGSSDPIKGLYEPCLLQSTLYKRAVGYFRSSVYLVAGKATIEFAQRGGKIQLICSPELDEGDIDTIRAGYSGRIEINPDLLITEIERMLSDPSTNYQTRVLATLVAVGALEIKIAMRPTQMGLYHEKIGIFIDDHNNRVSFIGSANESWSGWHSNGNFESIEVFCSWQHPSESERSARHELNFDNLWAGNTKDVQTIAFPEAAFDHLRAKSYQTLEDAKNEIQPDPESFDTLTIRRSPLPHQLDAINSWRNQKSRGVFEHATGSGKTFTALEAARSHLGEGLPVLILVPSALLLQQWNEEVKTEYPDSLIVLAGAGNDRWKRPGKLRALTSEHSTGSRVIIATMQTASTEYFRLQLSQGSHLMLIADEVHQIGSPQNSECLKIDTGDRLGLSATPTRYGDAEGTAKIFDYFGNVVPPPITLADAVKSGRLVEYEYFPHSINLTADEASEWRIITRKISFEVNKAKSEDGELKLTDRIKMLLIKRSRIAKKAQAKPRIAASILKENYEPGQSWLVYCEDSEQLKETIGLLKLEGINPVEYHTGMLGNRHATLDWFKKFGGVLVSIKCLDEGVDIPSVSHALILASSQNPRQFIQRRGRVLRTAPGKYMACIHDAIVVPVSVEDEPEQLSLLKSELLRAIEFSNSALNKSAGAELRKIARDIGFDPDVSVNDGIEEGE